MQTIKRGASSALPSSKKEGARRSPAPQVEKKQKKKSLATTANQEGGLAKKNHAWVTKGNERIAVECFETPNPFDEKQKKPL